jgi:hypothetical protein
MPDVRAVVINSWGQMIQNLTGLYYAQSHFTLYLQPNRNYPFRFKIIHSWKPVI